MIRCKPLLGTYVEISADTDNAIDQAFLAIQLVQDLMGFHNPNSELSQINARAHIEPIEVHEWTFQVLRIAQELCESTNGMFDCGVGKKLVDSGLLPKHSKRLNTSCGSIMDLELTEPKLASSKAPLTLDLGGIAKGFAVDKAVEALQQCGVASGYVNAGGDLRVFGNVAQEIQVRNPNNPLELIALGSLENGAIASSGLYYCDHSKFNQGHIVNPQTMEQIEFSESYSVIAPECIYADALTKVFAISKNDSHPCFQKYSAQAIEVAL
ncbi:FAD:protein FMN transferase [Polynucleobacter sp. MWH-UH25E]|uniref:FAD:protein FMN transferase n=1 Tax=Polynucleobacter sp. MWH-UH25E TaxID=1855616 RepID=UPI001BFEDB85|nr:FAD:protein FMN transferase [Polynucleobacter sp. MWH-UH25E]QWD62562.1 FAD:protein FMN transferase [Polynucleobacter sp. MWH-UH25E]